MANLPDSPLVTSVEHLERLDAYEYLVEAPTLDPDRPVRWSDTFEPTACLFSDVPNEMSSSWNGYLGKYVVMTTYRRDNALVIRTADAITGPWSRRSTCRT